LEFLESTHILSEETRFEPRDLILEGRDFPRVFHSSFSGVPQSAMSLQNCTGSEVHAYWTTSFSIHCFFSTFQSFCYYRTWYSCFKGRV